MQFRCKQPITNGEKRSGRAFEHNRNGCNSLKTALLLESLFKWTLLASIATMAATYLLKDERPDPDYYDFDQLGAPVQTATQATAFSTEVNGQRYLIKPLFDYQLEGVVVSYHDADSMADIWHHGRWQDFINVRDLCVVWGNNVRSGVYRDMDFSNDSWTCWAYWPDRETRARFSMTQLSNNHLLSDDEDLKSMLMAARPGDHIRLRGMLAAYANPGNGFQRGSSTTRTDTGNGACETIFLQDFEIINEANPGIRTLYAASKWLSVVSLFGFIVMFIVAPVRKPGLR